jgi:hypothetical protein
MKFKLGYIKQVIKEEIQSFANEIEQPKDPYFEKSINVERPQELDKWFALLDMAKNHLPMACQANDPISQDIISGLDDIHGWLTKTFQGAENIEDNPAYSGMMNENLEAEDEDPSAEEADIIQDKILRQMLAALEQGLKEIYAKRGIKTDFEKRKIEALELRRMIEREIENDLHDMTMAYVRETNQGEEK